MTDAKEFKCFIPLTNFESELSRIELAPGYLIRKSLEAERQIVDKYFTRWPKIAYGDFVLQCTSTQEDLKRDVTLWEVYAEKAVLVLRLYHEGIIGYNIIVLAPQMGTRYTGVLSRRPWASADVLESQLKYGIRRDEVQELQRFFAEFIAARLDGLDLAAEYFNKSYEESHTPRDSFVDLIIALENLYLKGEGQELGYKLRMRMSHVLSKDIETRKQIFKNMKEAYNLRSQVIHGTKRYSIDSSMLLEIRDYVRKSLCIFIRNHTLGENLDEMVLAGTGIQGRTSE